MNHLHFLLQSNLVNEEDQAPYIAALDTVQARGLATWSYVKLVPFAGTVEPEFILHGRKVFPIGSTSMLAASQRYGWTPGVVFDPLTFRFEAWRDNWGAANLVNHDAKVTVFGNAGAKVEYDDSVFIRPCEDLKAFSGLVITGEELEVWQMKVAEGQQSTSYDSQLLKLSTPVIVSPVKAITREWRTWVVGGEVVAWSQYAYHGQRARTRDVPANVLSFAQRLADYWCPADCFVLDVGEVDGKLGLMEVNTLNSSGIYEGDMIAVYSAIADLYRS